MPQQHMAASPEQPTVVPPRSSSSSAAVAAEVAELCTELDPSMQVVARMCAALGASLKDGRSLKRQLDRVQDARSQQARRLTEVTSERDQLRQQTEDLQYRQSMQGSGL